MSKQNNRENLDTISSRGVVEKATKRVRKNRNRTWDSLQDCSLSDIEHWSNTEEDQEIADCAGINLDLKIPPQAET